MSDSVEPSLILELVSRINVEDPHEIQSHINEFLREVTDSESVFSVAYLRQRQELLCQTVNSQRLQQDVRLPLDNVLLAGSVCCATEGEDRDTSGNSYVSEAKFYEHISLQPLGPLICTAALSGELAQCRHDNTNNDQSAYHSSVNFLVVPVWAPDSSSQTSRVDGGREAYSADVSRVLMCAVSSQRPFTQLHVEQIRQVARYVGSCLVHSVSAQEQQRVQRHHQSLLNVTDSIFRHLGDVRVLLLDIMSQARRLTLAERCSLFMVEEHTGDLVATVFDVAEGQRLTRFKEDMQEEIRLPVGTGIIGHVAATGKQMNIHDAYSHPLFYNKMDQITGFRTRNILCFPIKNESGVLAVAELCNKVCGGRFSSGDQEAAAALAVYCGIALFNTLMYNRLWEAQERGRLANELMMYHMKVSDREVDLLCDQYTKVTVCGGSVTSESRDLLGDEWECTAPRDVSVSQWPSAVMVMYERLGLLHRFSIQQRQLARFVLMVRRGYRDTPYHNFSHALAVTHFAYLLVTKLQLHKSAHLDDVELLALMTACLCHDLDHRGTTSSFQVTSRSALASLYSSQGSVMERHHFAQTVCILNTDGCDILGQLTRHQYTRCLDMIHDMILATDVGHHSSMLSQLQQSLSTSTSSECLPVGVGAVVNGGLERAQLIRALLISACDLSDQTKDWLYSKQLAKLVYREFFSQGDLEKQMGAAPVPMMDRERAFVPLLQLNFFDNVVLPLYSALERVFGAAVAPLLSQARHNRACWHEAAQYAGDGCHGHDVFDSAPLEQHVLSKLGARPAEHTA